MSNTQAARPVSRRVFFNALAGGAVAALTAPHVARAAQRTARFGHNNTDDSHFGLGASAFAAAVAADPALGGVLKIEVYGNARLGDDITMLKACTAGSLDGMLSGSSIMSNFVPEVGILNAPYLFRDAVQARSVLDGKLGLEFMELSRGKGLPVLAWGENGLRHITSNQAVRKVADLKGLKIRVPQSAVMLDGFRAMGAAAAPLAYPLVREALRTGEFQAQENAITLVESAKLYEVQKYLCLTGHIYDGIGFIASPDLLEDLTEPQRVALAGCARKGAATTREISDANARDGIGRLKAVGMTVIDDVDVAGFRAVARPYLESLGGAFGANRVKSLLEAGA